MAARWLDLVDPTGEDVRSALPFELDPPDLAALTAPARERARPLLESRGTYVLGTFVALRSLRDEDRIVSREVGVVATSDLLLTVRKTPWGGSAWEPAPLAAARDAAAGELLHLLVDDIAESFLDVVDATDAEIDELEDHIDEWTSEQVRRRLSALRRDLLDARRTVGTTRAAVRRIVDGTLDVGPEPLFPERVERLFADTYDSLFRAGEELDVARELLSSSRDYHQSLISERQNEVVKTLTVIASLLLLPTLIVGFYGQNFVEAFNDPYWTIGTSVFLIVASTVLQLVLFRWRRWI